MRIALTFGLRNHRRGPALRLLSREVVDRETGVVAELWPFGAMLTVLQLLPASSRAWRTRDSRCDPFAGQIDLREQRHRTDRQRA
jgi:hypothetical protein